MSKRKLISRFGILREAVREVRDKYASDQWIIANRTGYEMATHYHGDQRPRLLFDAYVMGVASFGEISVVLWERFKKTVAAVVRRITR